jgi:hypothetical protein
VDSRQQLSRAVVLGIGFKRATAPSYERARLVAEFGTEQSAKLEPLVLALLKELRALDVDWKTHTLVTAGEWARLEMHRRHPALSDDALRALEWQFTFDSR